MTQKDLLRPGGRKTRTAGMAGILTTLLVLAVLTLTLCLSPPPARAAIEKEVLTVLVDSGTSESATVRLGNSGTLSKVYLVSPAAASTTKTLQLIAWNGRLLPEITIASETITESGTTALSTLAGQPVWGETRIKVLTGANEVADRTFYVLLYYLK